MRKYDDNIINMEVERGGNLKRKAERISEVIGGSISNTLSHKNTWDIVMTVGAVRGLYKWNAKSGLIAGAVTVGILVGIDVVGNVAGNIKYINRG